MRMSKKRVLILGGTGAMGTHLQRLLAQEYDLTVTSRKKRESTSEVTFVKGNAKDLSFLTEILKNKWDVIVDFMVYSTQQFQERAQLFLKSTDQYVFLSSARVYADQGMQAITEKSERLLDVVQDKEYLATDEYALSKARQEDVLISSQKNNWTIVRPSLTYNTEKLQLGAYEKENWLYRALNHRTIVFSEDLLDVFCTMTLGDDVAEGIAAIIGNGTALGEIYHIVGQSPIKWSGVLECYLSVLEQRMGTRPKVVMTEKCTNLKLPSSSYKLKYGRYFNRVFDNSKINGMIDTSSWVEAKEGLTRCLNEFLDSPRFSKINWSKEALIDQAAKERTPLSQIKGAYNKFTYVCYRYHLSFLCTFVDKLIKLKKK